jgi:transcriptional regulator with XRE-family HTH domain
MPKPKSKAKSSGTPQARIDRYGKLRKYDAPGRPLILKTPLAIWIHEQNKDRDEFAEELGISKSYLDKICSGSKKPSRKVINKLASKTNNAINWTHFPDDV